MDVTVRDRHPDIELVSPVYFCNHKIYSEHFVERTDTSIMMKTVFRFDPSQDESGGILTYKVQRKSGARSNYPMINTTHARVENAIKIMRLLITWRIKHLGRPKVNVVLVEYDHEIVLNKDKLVQLYKVNDILSGHDLSRWLMYDTTALKTEHEVVRNEGPKLKIIISRKVEDKHTKSAL
jgi:hypothetical protein